MSNCERCALLSGLLREALQVIEPMAEDTTYGGILASDPRDYHPDRECCTPEEIAAWEDACKRAEAGEFVEIPRSHWRPFASEQEASEYVLKNPGVAAVSYAGPAPILSHVNVQTWGIGTSTIRDPGMIDLRDRIIEALS